MLPRATRIVVRLDHLRLDVVEVRLLHARVTGPLKRRLKQRDGLLAGRSPSQCHHAVLPLPVLDQLEHLFPLFVPDLVNGDFVEHVGCSGHSQSLLLVLLPLCLVDVV